jgi:hypothetical protein
MGINKDKVPYANRNPLEGATPAPDRKDEHYETKLLTTVDEKEATGARLQLEALSRDTRRDLEEDLLPTEQSREDELTRVRDEARRRERTFERRKKLADRRIELFEFLSLPVGEQITKYERWAVPAIVCVEGPLAFVAGYSLVGGISTGDARIDTPLKLAPLGFALGVAVVCCMATIFGGRVLSAYFEQRRVIEFAALAASDYDGVSADVHDDVPREKAA